MIKWIIIVGLIAVVLLCTMCLMTVHSDSDDIDYAELIKHSMEENTENKRLILSDNLSDLERESVNKLIKELNILLFEKNKNINVTVGECLDNAENGRYTILQSGKVIGFTI